MFVEVVSDSPVSRRLNGSSGASGWMSVRWK